MKGVWKGVYLEDRILAAGAVELIHILYEHAVHQIGTARLALASGDDSCRARAISKTLAILDELDRSLDYSAGGAISQNLARLYEYMRGRLLHGNENQEDAPLAEVASLLQTIDEGWTVLRDATEPPVEWRASGQPSPFIAA